MYYLGIHISFTKMPTNAITLQPQALQLVLFPFNLQGWCGWKGPDFWKKDAYYNLCLPQRPKSI